jgi:hypothetical protein
LLSASGTCSRWLNYLLACLIFDAAIDSNVGSKVVDGTGMIKIASTRGLFKALESKKRKGDDENVMAQQQDQSKQEEKMRGTPTRMLDGHITSTPTTKPYRSG